MSLWPPCGLFPGSAYYFGESHAAHYNPFVPLSGKKDVACAACDSPFLLTAIVIVIVEFHMFHMFPVLGAGQYYYVPVPVCISSPACTLSAYAYPVCDFAAAALACQRMPTLCLTAQPQLPPGRCQRMPFVCVIAPWQPWPARCLSACTLSARAHLAQLHQQCTAASVLLCFTCVRAACACLPACRPLLVGDWR